ncbi:MAG: hypothetical protein WAO08_19780 [Hyphomicrobiaceae bacterium]
MAFGQHGHERHRIQRPFLEAGITGWHDNHFDFAAIEQVPQLGPARFLQLDLDERMPPLMPRKKISQKALDHLRRGAHPKQTSLPCLQGSGPLTERADVCQQTAAMS